MPWLASERDEVVKALAIVCEVTGTSLSGPARTFMLGELAGYPVKDVLLGLRKCGRECKGKLSLGDVVRAIEHVDRKALSDARAARSVYLTQLRGAALVERIPWNEADPESVRRELEAKGYNFGRKAVPAPARTLPHWNETEKD